MRRWSLLAVAMLALLQWRCGGPGEFAEVAPWSVIDTLRATTWYGGKRAACSIAFDDTRLTHMTVAAPVLEAHGFRGTFNLVSSRVGNWPPWQRMFDAGHEIANHTRTHRHMGQLTPQEASAEIALGKRALIDHIAGLWDVPSFTYPYGDEPDWCSRLVGEHHVSARVGQGLESCTPRDMLRIKGIGYYDPFVIGAMTADIDAAIAGGGWYLPYFHSVITEGPGSSLDCPVTIFSAWLDSLRARETELWVAPQGVVAAYIRQRQGFRSELRERGGSLLWFDTGPDPSLYILPLTVACVFKPGMGEVRLTLDAEAQVIPAGTESTMIMLIPGRKSRLQVETREGKLRGLVKRILG